MYDSINSSAYARNHFIAYQYPEIISFDYTGITIHNVGNGQWVNFDANSTPAFNVTEVLQATSDGADIYVADADTGWLLVSYSHQIVQ